jgi:uncharacterized SAM-binding protein YcdF (DUF218 family)
MNTPLDVVLLSLAASAGVLFWGGLLWWSLRRDPRSLRNGFLAIVLAHHVLGLVVSATSRVSEQDSVLAILTAVVGIVVVLGLLALPWLLVVDGVVMLRRERRSLGNSLSLLAGLALLALPVVLVLLLRHEDPVTGSLAVALLTAQACVSICLLAFMAQTVLYARVARHAPAHAVIVLGAGLVDGQVPPLLAARLGRAVSAAEERDGPQGRPVIVPSGGQGHDEPRPEGEAMGEWLRRHGVPADDVLVEDRSRSTRENLILSARLLEQHGVPGPYLIVTNDYHAPRAAMLARELGIDAQAIGASTALYYVPSAYLREFVAVMTTQRVLLGGSAVVVIGMTVLAWLSISTR